MLGKAQFKYRGFLSHTHKDNIWRQPHQNTYRRELENCKFDGEGVFYIDQEGKSGNRDELCSIRHAYEDEPVFL